MNDEVAYYAIFVLPVPDRFDISATTSHAPTDVVATVVVEAMQANAHTGAAAIIEFVEWRKVVFIVICKSKGDAL